ncbi:MAG TPA: OsmC family protein [Methanothrix sp.]|nr:OsmC family protein [Methanothrix sp.]HPJ84486.1 OsmC family protein [Methanothrix sp.]HPR66455.1 OsmC family protein [Methanothrix sp.]
MNEIVNGIDVLRLHRTIDEVGKEPEKGRFTIRTRTEWGGGCRCRTFIERGRKAEGMKKPVKFVVESDEPPALMGRDLAPNAVEFVLHALASCIEVGFVLRAALVGIKIEAMELSLEGDIDLNNFFGLSEDSRPGLQNVSVRCAVVAAASKGEIEALCREVVKRSAVMDIVQNPVPVSVEMMGR